MNMKSICLSFTGLILFSTTALADHYYELRVLGDPKTERQDKSIPNMYWRTHANDENKGFLELYDLCAGNKQFGSAKGDDSQWSLESLNAETEIGRVDAQGNLVVILPNGKRYAEGHEIQKLECKDGKPSTQPVKVVPPPKKMGSGDGFSHMQAAWDKTLRVTVPKQPVQGEPETIEVVQANTIVCSAAPLTETAVRELTDAPALAKEPNIYPGSLLQGKELAQGRFTPISGPKTTGATLSIDGLTFASDEADYSISVDDLKPSTVKNQIMKLTHQKIAPGSTQAQLTYSLKQVYSLDQLAFEAGVDIRFAKGAFASNFKVNSDAKKTSTLMRFQQIYYTISVDPFGYPFNAFADGEQFKDVMNQIGDDNPPLYVSSVSYGRVVYLLVTSTSSSLEVQAALEAAYKDKAADLSISANASTTFKSIMSNSEVQYFALGGRAVDAVKPILAKTPDQMFDEVKKFIANEKSAEATNINLGLPVAYTIGYLIGDSVASMGYATSYAAKKCEIVPTQYYNFTLHLTCVDDEWSLYDYDNLGTEARRVGPLTSAQDIQLDTLVQVPGNQPEQAKDVKFKASEYNRGGPWCHNFKLERTKADPKDPKKIERMWLQADKNTWGPNPYEFTAGGGSKIGANADFVFTINRGTGRASVLQW